MYGGSGGINPIRGTSRHLLMLKPEAGQPIAEVEPVADAEDSDEAMGESSKRIAETPLASQVHLSKTASIMWSERFGATYPKVSNLSTS